MDLSTGTLQWINTFKYWFITLKCEFCRHNGGHRILEVKYVPWGTWTGHGVPWARIPEIGRPRSPGQGPQSQIAKEHGLHGQWVTHYWDPCGQAPGPLNARPVPSPNACIYMYILATGYWAMCHLASSDPWAPNSLYLPSTGHRTPVSQYLGPKCCTLAVMPWNCLWVYWSQTIWLLADSGLYASFTWTCS